jgi:hypothetical protein
MDVGVMFHREEMLFAQFKVPLTCPRYVPNHVPGARKRRTTVSPHNQTLCLKSPGPEVTMPLATAFDYVQSSLGCSGDWVLPLCGCLSPCIT